MLMPIMSLMWVKQGKLFSERRFPESEKPDPKLWSLAPTGEKQVLNWLSAHHFIPDRNISATTEQIAVEFCIDIHGPHMMNSNYIVDALTFPLMLFAGEYLWFGWNISTAVFVFVNFVDSLTFYLAP